MHIPEILKPKGGRARRFITWLAYGIIGGTCAGILVGLIWVSVEYLLTFGFGSGPAWSWVMYIYSVSVIIFGFGGAVLGTIVGLQLGIWKSKDQGA